MSKHVTLSPEEAADRLAIRELIEAYARCADRRDAKGQMALFTSDTHFVVYMNAKDPTPSQELHSREALAPVFADLNQYAATMHFVGQSTIFTLTGDRATGEAYCIAHHLTLDGEKRRMMVAYLRYLDTFAKSMACGSLPSACCMSTGWSSAPCHDRSAARLRSSCHSVALTGGVASGCIFSDVVGRGDWRTNLDAGDVEMINSSSVNLMREFSTAARGEFGTLRTV
jgi:SnoaL-like domain